MTETLTKIRPTWSADEVEAAMCIWEEALCRNFQGNRTLFEWLACGEGSACARNRTMELAKDCERSYLFAVAEGYDDCFDWDFVPQWLDLAMEQTQEMREGDAWVFNLGMKIAHEFKHRVRTHES